MLVFTLAFAPRSLAQVEPPHFNLQNIGVGFWPYGVAVADVDGNGLKDIAVACDYDSLVIIFKQTSLNVWTFSQQITVGRPGVPGFPSELAFAYMTSATLGPDEYIDLVVTLTGDRRVEVLRGLPGGLFADDNNTITLTDAGGTPVREPVGLVVHDWDNNGNQDIAVAGYQLLNGVERPTLGLLFGENDSSFQRKAFPLTAELDRGYDLTPYYWIFSSPPGVDAPLAPSQPRLAMTNTDRYRLHTFRYTTARNFASTSYSGFPSFGIATADLDGDADEDLGSTFGTTNSAGWYRNTSTVFELGPNLVSLANGAVGVAAGFLNRTSSGTIETNNDLVAAVGGASAVSVMVNIGPPNYFDNINTYQFDALPGFTVAPRQVIVTDVNNDGFPDVLATVAGPGLGGSVSVFLNTWP